MNSLETKFNKSIIYLLEKIITNKKIIYLFTFFISETKKEEIELIEINK